MALYFQCHEKNIQHEEICAFLRHMLSHLHSHVIVRWDRAAIHRGDRIRELCRRFPRLHLELLPPYAPDLNPDEEVWSFAKGLLSNGRPEDLAELHTALVGALRRLGRSQRRLRSCIHRSDLPPFLI